MYTYIDASRRRRRPQLPGILATQRWHDMFGKYPKT